jgi:hypothetical protein
MKWNISPEGDTNGELCVALRAYEAQTNLSVGLRRRQFLCRPPG